MSSDHMDDRQRLPTGWAIPAGVVTGAAIGMLFGIMLQALVLGLIVGAAVGLVAGASGTAVTATPADRRRAVLAVATGLLTAGFVIVLLIVLR